LFFSRRLRKTARRGQKVAVPHWINFLERSDDKWAVEAEERERRGCNERKGVLGGRYKRKKKTSRIERGTK